VNTSIGVVRKKKKKNNMSFVNVPWGVSVCVLREWLGMENTAKLDTAMCCIEGREKLLEILGSGEVVYEGYKEDFRDIMAASQVKWIGLRGISLLGLAVRSDVTPEMVLSVTRNSPGLNILRLEDVVGL